MTLFCKKTILTSVAIASMAISGAANAQLSPGNYPVPGYAAMMQKAAEIQNVAAVQNAEAFATIEKKQAKKNKKDPKPPKPPELPVGQTCEVECNKIPTKQSPTRMICTYEICDKDDITHRDFCRSETKTMEEICEKIKEVVSNPELCTWKNSSGNPVGCTGAGGVFE